MPEAQNPIVLIRPSSNHCFALSVTVPIVVEWYGHVFIDGRHFRFDAHIYVVNIDVDDDVIVVFRLMLSHNHEKRLHDYKRDYKV